MIMRLVIAALFLGLTACSQPSGDTDASMPSMTWWVNTDTALITFATVKNTDVREEHEITGITGSVTESGAVTIRLDMNQVETFIDIRNERMREYLFETEDYPEAQVTAQFDPAIFADVELGGSTTVPVDFTLTLRDIPINLDAMVTVSLERDDLVRVETAEPIAVPAEPLDLVAGIETLRGLAGLESIDPEITVDFNLEFVR